MIVGRFCETPWRLTQTLLQLIIDFGVSSFNGRMLFFVYRDAEGRFRRS